MTVPPKIKVHKSPHNKMNGKLKETQKKRTPKKRIQKVKKMEKVVDIQLSDENLIKNIMNTHFLGEGTKKLYLRRLEVVQKDIWKDCNTSGYNLYCILCNPIEFFEKLDKVPGKMGYLIALMALFKYNQTLKEQEHLLFNQWNDKLEQYKEVQRDAYRKNEPTEKQRKAFMTFEEVCAIRDNLPPEYQGTQEHILIQLFTEMPPLRANDFYSTRIYHRGGSQSGGSPKETQKSKKQPLQKEKKKTLKTTQRKVKRKLTAKLTPSETQKIPYEVPPELDDDTIVDKNLPEIHSENSGNYIEIYPDKIQFVLQDYKTKHTYKNQRFELPPNVSRNIRNLVAENPGRSYLFMSTKNKPFNQRKSFNIWANTALRKIFNNNHFTLTMFRHIYISRPDLNLRSKSGLEQQAIANRMCHSIASQQQSYHWINVENVET